MTDHKEKTRREAALVTGGGVRLGKAIALALAEDGYDIALHYHSSEAAACKTAEEIRSIGVACDTFCLDLKNVTDIPQLIENVCKSFPHFSILVNAAAGYTQKTIRETEAVDFDEQIAVNFRAPFFLSQAFAKIVGKGHILNVLDNKIGFNQNKYSAYLLSKKALAEFTKMAAIEFAPNIRVNGVAPGVVLPASTRSDEYIRWRVDAIPLKRKGETHHITSAILHLLDNTFITGQILVVDGGEVIGNSGRNAGDFDQSKV